VKGKGALVNVIQHTHFLRTTKPCVNTWFLKPALGVLTVRLNEGDKEEESGVLNPVVNQWWFGRGFGHSRGS
jgi:hypothetical protein